MAGLLDRDNMSIRILLEGTRPYPWPPHAPQAWGILWYVESSDQHDFPTRVDHCIERLYNATAPQDPLLYNHMVTQLHQARWLVTATLVPDYGNAFHLGPQLLAVFPIQADGKLMEILETPGMALMAIRTVPDSDP